MGIHHHQEHLSQEGASVVDVQPHPGAFRPVPRVERCSGGCFLILLTLGTALYSCFKVFVDSQPPHITSAEALHPCDSWMALVQLIKDLGAACRRHNDSNSPQETSILDGEFVLPSSVWKDCFRLQLLPSFQNHLPDL